MSNRNRTHVLSRAAIIHQDKILLCKTLDMPMNFYHLPGGHVENGESTAESLLRELQEKTGHECRIKKFLGCLEYSFEPQYPRACHDHEYNFVFEAESENLTSDKKTPCSEEYLELIWMPVTSLSDIDFRAAPLKELLPKWLAENTPNTLTSEKRDEATMKQTKSVETT